MATIDYKPYIEPYIEQVKAIYGRLTLIQKITIGVVLAASIIGIATLFLMSDDTKYATLYTDLTAKDASAIVEWLKKEGVKYKLVKEGAAIQVPEGLVYDLRLALANDGLPKDPGVGFEIFDKTNLGATDFVQHVNYQRALQGELERTIARYPQVKEVRVHIAEPKESLFVTERHEPSASVLLTLKPDETLTRRQLIGIVNLVSSSVPRLKKKRVTIMDTSGAVLLQGEKLKEERPDLTRAQVEYQRRLETYYKHKLQTMLEEALGPKKAVARVSVEVDFSKVEINEEKYDPEMVAIRSQQKVLARKEGAETGGIPGVKGGLASKLQGNVGLKSKKSGIMKQEEITNWEISKTEKKVRGAVGRIVRISAGVLVDGAYEVKDGKVKYIPRTEEEIKELENLVRAAIGYNEERGDEVKVINVPFSGTRPKVADAMTRTIEIISKVAKPFSNVLLAVLFIFFVIRPILNKYVLGVKDEEIEAIEGAEEEEEEEGLEEDIEAAPAIEPMPSAQEELQGLAADYPERAAALIKIWLREPMVETEA